MKVKSNKNCFRNLILNMRNLKKRCCSLWFTVVIFLFGIGTGWSNWPQPAKLLPPDGAANDYFGATVATSGEYAVGWQIGFWSNVPPDAVNPYNRPEKLLWLINPSTDRIRSTEVGIDTFPERPNDVCYHYLRAEFVTIRSDHFC